MTRIRSMKRVVIAAVPVGNPIESDFRLEQVEAPEPGESELLVRTLWVSVDPYLKGRMTGNSTYIAPIPLGGVMESGAVGEVVQSTHPDFKVGDVVTGMWGWQEYAVVSPARVQKLDPSQAPVSTAIGILGMPGMTA